jgi:membrane protein implicated in regulation of membrane protease activity
MIGARAKVVATCRPDGEVWIEGARWRANCEAGADVGDMVTVTSRQGLVLFVERA